MDTCSDLWNSAHYTEKKMELQGKSRIQKDRSASPSRQNQLSSCKLSWGLSILGGLKTTSLRPKPKSEALFPMMTQHQRRKRPKKVAPPPSIWQSIFAPKHRRQLILVSIFGGIVLTTLIFRSCSSVTPAPFSPAVGQPGFTSPATIAPGSITAIDLEPVPAIPGTMLHAVVTTTTGVVGGAVTLTYQWLRNNQPLDNVSGNELDTTGFAKHDTIAVEVTPFIGREKGLMVRSSSLVLQNRPPTIIPTALGTYRDGHYLHEVKAEDQDQDDLTFSLATGPPEMTIDPKTGRIDWPVPPAAKGVYAFNVVVTDGEATAVQTFRITLDLPEKP
jgi:hypothetical protein